MKKFHIDFVAVGPQRAGTSWLHANFMNHSEVCLPKEPVKETFFFDKQYHRGLSWYQRHFSEEVSHSKGKVGEFGPSYFDIEPACHRIYETSPACKIIINVRNPADKAFSLFLHHLKRGRVPPDFGKAIEKMPRIIASGHYKLHIQRWIGCFGLDRVHFVFLDDIKENPLQTLNEMCDFLEISPFQADRILAKPINTAYLPKHLWIQHIKNSIFRFARDHHGYGFLSFGRKVNELFASWTSAKASPESHPVLSVAQQQALHDLYAEDIAFLEGLFKRSFSMPEKVGKTRFNSERLRKI